MRIKRFMIKLTVVIRTLLKGNQHKMHLHLCVFNYILIHYILYGESIQYLLTQYFYSHFFRNKLYLNLFLT